MLNKREKSVTLKNIADRLTPSLIKLSELYKSVVIEDLSFVSDPYQIERYGFYYVPVKDKDGNQAKLKFKKDVREAASKNYTINISTSIDIRIEEFQLSKWGELTITISAMRESGVSLNEIKKRKIIKYCTAKAYFTRLKKPLPLVIRRIALITTEGSTIESDINCLIGLKKENICLYRSKNNNAEDMSQKIYDAINKRDFDVIALFRGGRDDDAMLVFSQIPVIEAVIHSNIPVITGLGHEIDSPIIEAIADKSYQTPTALAKDIYHHNHMLYQQINSMSKQINENLYIVTKDIVKAIINSINNTQTVIAKDMEQLLQEVMTTTYQNRGGFYDLLKRKRDYLKNEVELTEDMFRKLIALDRGQFIENQQSVNSYMISILSLKQQWMKECQRDIVEHITSNLLDIEQKESKRRYRRNLILVSGVALIIVTLIFGYFFVISN